MPDVLKEKLLKNEQILGLSDHFKSDEVGSKVSKNKVWPTVGRARVRASQRTLDK